jgi:hypothetical protein
VSASAARGSANEAAASTKSLADAALPADCGGHVVFLTSPVAVRGVYTHFYYETFEPLTLTLAVDRDLKDVLFFFYSDGAMRKLPPPE